MKRTDKPNFGTLADVKVALAGISIASPFAAELLAENGADVIWIENPRMPDPTRSPYGWSGPQDRRNMRALTVNFGAPEGKQLFLRLIEQVDIFIEGSRGCTFAEWGLDDETLWESNPALVIVHISGFGQTGDPQYVCRSSWDGIGQAFSGYMGLNGYPEPEPPMRVSPLICDYVTALNACWAALAGLHKARQSGEGESIDIAQYEVMLRIQSDYPLKYMNWGRNTARNGNTDSMMCGYFPYKCKDGKYLFTAWVGATALKDGLPLLGFEWGSEDFPKEKIWIQQGSTGAKKFEAAFIHWCAARTVEEAEKELIAAGVPCSPIMTFEDMQRHPHYQAREVFTEWDDPERGHVKGYNFVPKFTQHPQQMWRPAPGFGEDNRDILAELGYTAEEVQTLVETKTIVLPQPKPA
jgi:L-carnitine CoA-transferase